VISFVIGIWILEFIVNKFHYLESVGECKKTARMSFSRKRESSCFNKLWIPAFARMTRKAHSPTGITYLEVNKVNYDCKESGKW
jgi:hypothetical protein